MIKNEMCVVQSLQNTEEYKEIKISQDPVKQR